MTRKFLKLLFITLCAIEVCFSQERVNRSKIEFQKQSEVVSSAIGWAYNDEIGEWVDYINLISPDRLYKDKFPTLVNSTYLMSKASQNFIDMRFKTISYNDKVYYVLLINKWVGSYKYPNIKEEWQEIKVAEAYVFEAKEYSKIFNKDSTNEMLCLNNVTTISSSNTQADENRLLDLIQTEFKSTEYRIKYAFPFLRTQSKEQKIVRFITPTYHFDGSKINLSKQYFEITNTEFDKLIIK